MPIENCYFPQHLTVFLDIQLTILLFFQFLTFLNNEKYKFYFIKNNEFKIYIKLIYFINLIFK